MSSIISEKCAWFNSTETTASSDTHISQNWMQTSPSHCKKLKKKHSFFSKSHWKMDRTTRVLRVPLLVTYIWQILVHRISSISYSPKSLCSNKNLWIINTFWNSRGMTNPVKRQTRQSKGADEQTVRADHAR